MEHKNVGWCIIPPWVLARNDLSMTQKVLFGRILGLSEQRGYCWATNAYLSEAIGVAEQTITNNLSKMAAKGIIRIELERKGQARTVRKIYPLWPQSDQKEALTDFGKCSEEDLSNRICPERALTDSGNCPPEHLPESVTAPPEHLPGSVSREVEVLLKNRDTTENRKANEYSDDFEKFWNVYPRKVAKATAYKKWRQLVRKNGGGPDVETLVKAANNYRAACHENGTEERFIMHAATFLGPGRRWEDYLEPPSSSVKKPTATLRPKSPVLQKIEMEMEEVERQDPEFRRAMIRAIEQRFRFKRERPADRPTGPRAKEARMSEEKVEKVGEIGRVVQFFKLPRTGDIPVEFYGELLASRSGRDLWEREHSYWYEVTIYKSIINKFIVAISYRTTQGDEDYDHVVFAEDPEHLVQVLRDYGRERAVSITFMGLIARLADDLGLLDD